MRYTKKDVAAAMERLARLTDKKVASKYGEIGGLFLDYNPTYGGYVIGEYIPGSVDGAIGERHPFGEMRKSAAELVATITFVERAMEVLDCERVAEVYRGLGHPQNNRDNRQKYYSHEDHLVHVVDVTTDEAPCGTRRKSLSKTAIVNTRWCQPCREARTAWAKA